MLPGISQHKDRLGQSYQRYFIFVRIPKIFKIKNNNGGDIDLATAEIVRQKIRADRSHNLFLSICLGGLIAVCVFVFLCVHYDM